MLIVDGFAVVIWGDGFRFWRQKYAGGFPICYDDAAGCRDFPPDAYRGEDARRFIQTNPKYGKLIWNSQTACGAVNRVGLIRTILSTY